MKTSYKNNKFKSVNITMNLNYPIDDILYQISKIILSILSENMEHKLVASTSTDNTNIH